MFDRSELSVLRKAYSRHVTFLADTNNPALEAVYARVPREDYLGEGPWQIFRCTGYKPTPDNDPAWLYADILVGLVPERSLNNGQPSSHAAWIAAAAPAPGDHVGHGGGGVGYYSAIMAHMVGPAGHLTAIEFDPSLAARAATNLAHLPNAEVIQGAGSLTLFAPADVIYVNAGASNPADAWLDSLHDGGRLILPLTTNSNFTRLDPTRPSGAVFRITRRGEVYEADFVSGVTVFPCEGMRDEASALALAEAFAKGGYRDVNRVHRSNDLAEQDCWVKAPGWSLAYC